MYLDYVNIKGVPLSGDIITAATFNNDNSYAGLGLPQALTHPPSHKLLNLNDIVAPLVISIADNNLYDVLTAPGIIP